MAKLGESKLGSTQFATPAEFEIGENVARERAEEHIKHTFPTGDGTVWDQVLSTILYEFEVENEVIEQIVNGRFVDSAERYQLGMIGDFFGLERRRDEEDGHFRARIKQQIPRHTTTTTIDEILNASAELLDTSTERIHIEENFGIEPARFDVYIEDIVFSEAGIDVDDFEDLLQDLKAAGVKAMATVGKQFTYRSVGDFEDGINTEDQGYGDFPHEVVDWPDGHTWDTSLGYSQLDGYDSGGTLQAGAEPTEGLGGPYADEITEGLT